MHHTNVYMIIPQPDVYMYKAHFVEHFIKVTELCHLLHHLLLHEERCVERRETFSMECPHGVLDESLFKKDSCSLKEGGRGEGRGGRERGGGGEERERENTKGRESLPNANEYLIRNLS